MRAELRLHPPLRASQICGRPELVTQGRPPFRIDRTRYACASYHRARVMGETDRAIRNIASRDAKGFSDPGVSCHICGTKYFLPIHNKCQPNEQVDKQTGRYDGPDMNSLRYVL